MLNGSISSSYFCSFLTSVSLSNCIKSVNFCFFVFTGCQPSRDGFSDLAGSKGDGI